MRIVPANRRRRGFLLAAVLLVLLVTSTVIFSLHTQAMSGMRQVEYIRDDTQHMYSSEAILSMLVNRLKKTPWKRRFYATDPNVVPERCWSAVGTGEFRGAEYQWVVQDIEEEGGQPRPEATDVFVKVTYKGAVQNFAERVGFRQPTPLRPTVAVVQRFARTAKDILDPAERAIVVASLGRDEAAWRANRSASRVVGRILEYAARHDWPVSRTAGLLLGAARVDVPPAAPVDWGNPLELALSLTARRLYAGITADQAAGAIARPPSRVRARLARDASAADLPPAAALADAQAALAADIDLEAKILAKWADGDQAIAAVPPNLDAARQRYEDAVAVTAAQGAVHRAVTAPRALFKLADALGRLAEREPVASMARLALLDRAGSLYERITAEFPGSRDAPHCYIPWGWLAVSAVNPADPGAWNNARMLAYSRFESLRRYPFYHLWGEDAVTTKRQPAVGPVDPVLDEIIWYEESLLQPKIAYLNWSETGLDLWIAGRGGEDPKRVTTNLIGLDQMTLRSFDMLSLLWSPGGNKLLVSRTVDQPAPLSSLLILDVGTGELRPMLESAQEVLLGCFTADGSQLVFSWARDNSGHKLYVMRADGSGAPVRLTNSQEEELSPQATPDGTTLYFLRTGQLIARRLADGVETVVKDGSGASLTAVRSGLALAPNGLRMALVRSENSLALHRLTIATPRRNGNGTTDWTVISSVEPLPEALFPFGSGFLALSWSAGGDALLASGVRNAHSGSLVGKGVTRIDITAKTATQMVQAQQLPASFPMPECMMAYGVFSCVESPMAP